MSKQEAKLARNEEDILDIVRDAHHQRKEGELKEKASIAKPTAVAATDLERQDKCILEVLHEAHEQSARNNESVGRPTDMKATKEEYSIPKRRAPGKTKSDLAEESNEKLKPSPKPEPTASNTNTAKTDHANFEKPGSAPAPTTLQRGPNIVPPPPDAGAFHTTSEGQTRPLPFDPSMLQQAERSTEALRTRWSLRASQNGPIRGLEGLIEADPVMDDFEPQEIPLAEELDPEQQEKKANEKRNKTCTFVWAAGVLSICGITLLLGFLLTGDHDKSAANQPISIQSTPFPSEAPSLSPEPYVLSLLPEGHTPSSSIWDAIDWLIDDPNFLNLSEDQIRQRLALATLYYSTGGDGGWVSSDNWVSYDTPECEWFSVNVTGTRDVITWLDAEGRLSYQSLANESLFPCNEEGVYIHLWLPQNDLEGSIPDELYLLTSLESILLGNNKQLEGSISSHLGKLTSLIWLDLGPSNLNSTIPTELGLLTNLHELFLGNARGLHGTLPTELGLLSAIQHEFNLNDNALTGTIPTEYGNLKDVQFFDFRNNQLTGNIPSEIGKLEKVRWLRFDHNTLNGTLASDMGRLSQLERLFLQNNQLSGPLPSEFGTMSNLTFFYLYVNSFTGPIPSELGLMTAVEAFYPMMNQLSGAIPSELGAFTHCTGLYINENALTGPIPSELGMLTILETLDLDNNKITGTIPSELANMDSMLGFEFNDCLLSGSIPSEFGSMSSLHILYLQGNDLTGSLPDGFDERAFNGTLVSLNITNTMISGQISEAVCGMGSNGCGKAYWLDECFAEFDCSSSLCGCYCPCLNIGTSESLAIEGRDRDDP